MRCPIDGTELTMTERQGIEIDYCPKCRGVWLDRGELDKIIERSGVSERRIDNPPPRHDDRYRDQDPRQNERFHEQRGYGRDYRHKHKKRKSILSEIFDFD